MYVGILTAPFSGDSLDQVAAFAAEYGCGGLEIMAGPGSKHIDTNNFTQADADRIKGLMEQRLLSISSLAAYCNNTDADPDKRKANNETVRKAIDAAQMLGVQVVCTLAGHPVPGKTKMKTIEEDCTEVFPPLLAYAHERGVGIALENWYATNIQ